MMGESGMVMGYWSAWHWIVFAASAALLLYPIGRILNRIGFSPLWAVIAVIPLANIIGLWIVALVAWPKDEGRTS